MVKIWMTFYAKEKTTQIMNIRKFYFSLSLVKLYFTRHLKENNWHIHQDTSCIINPIPVFANIITHGKNLDKMLDTSVALMSTIIPI
jgi:hypothetical protein